MEYDPMQLEILMEKLVSTLGSRLEGFFSTTEHSGQSLKPAHA